MTQPTEKPWHAFVRFAIEADLRFLSHRDCLRLFQRACIRAQVPLAWTRGFNPRPRLRLPLPRSVGMTASRELLEFQLDSPLPAENLADMLREHLPAGLVIRDVQLAQGKPDVVCRNARYRLTLGPAADQAELAARLAAFEDAQAWPVVRPQRGRHPRRTVDLRSAVRDFALADDALEITVQMDRETAPRIQEIRDVLALDHPAALNEIRRLDARFGQPIDSEPN